MTVNSQTTSFQYDGDGNLVKKINSNGSKTLYVGGIYEVDKTSGGSVTRTITYYPAAGAMRIDSTLYYVLKDHLGSASVVTNASGTEVGTQRYYPFGETRLTTGTIYTDKLFTGQREMAGLGIYHYQARFYSPKLGRFLSADTIVPSYANPQSLNRYSYVLGNPLKYTDPTEHCSLGGHWIPDSDSACQWASNNEGSLSGNGNGGFGNGNGGRDNHKPGEPRCQGRHCDSIDQILTGTVLGLDVIAAGVSLLEGLVAADAYILAGGACIASEFVGCVPAFILALQADMAATAIFGTAENGLGVLSFLFTAANDLLLGNTGIDPDIGPYIGKDTVVSGRNALAGFIPESFIDLGISISQVKYDLDRAMGNKSGGYVPVFDANSNWKMPPMHKDFLKQIFLKDWW